MHPARWAHRTLPRYGHPSQDYTIDMTIQKTIHTDPYFIGICMNSMEGTEKNFFQRFPYFIGIKSFENDES